MKVVGFAVAYSMVPLLEFDKTADGQVRVDAASVLDDIDEAPIADVAEVKYGYWIEKNNVSYCSVCGEGITGRNLFICDGENWIPTARFNYCSNCGAKMIKEDRT